jgi:RNA polymerase sigma-70 factor, ECF subfamily
VGDLLSRARTGDAAAFTALVRRHQRMVYSVALRMLWDRHEAEDLSQEVFMQLHRKLAHIESESHLEFWLRKVATRQAIDRLRRDSRHLLRPLPEEPRLSGQPAAEVSPAGDPLLQRRLRGLIAQLSADARAVVVLRYQEDMDPVEIGEALDMPVNTVKSHLKRSLATFRAQLGATAEDQVLAGDETHT